MKIYRNKADGQLYTIEHLIKDIKFLNRNANSGIYATPYKHSGKELVFKSKDKDECEKYVEDNFELIAKS